MEELVFEIKRNLEQKSTQELCQILNDQNKDEWSQEAFIAISQILIDRNELSSNSFFCSKCGVKSFDYDDYNVKLAIGGTGCGHIHRWNSELGQLKQLVKLAKEMQRKPK